MVLAIWPALFTGFHLLATRKHDIEHHGDDHQKQKEEEKKS